MKEGSFETIWRKLKTVNRRLIIFLLALLVIPLVIVVRIIKPWCWIRFGWFFGSRIGGFAFDVEYYLAEKKLGLHPEKAIDVFFYRWGKPCNTFFSKLTKRYLIVRVWAEPLYFANDWLPGGDQHKILPAIASCHSRDVKGLFRRLDPQLEFSNEETFAGQSFLNSIGMDKDEKFVCLIVRDSAYLKNADYHNFRNAEISTFEEAALALAEKGYWVFRMGKVVHKPLKVDHPRILDYANSEFRSDFLDIWLMANCFFCISTGTGLDNVANVFRVPVVYVNFIGPITLMISWYYSMTCPKKLIWRHNRRLLMLSEQLYYNYLKSEDYENEGIDVIDLSPGEIREAVTEMEARLRGTWEEKEEDKQLENRFWKIFRSYKDFDKYHGEIHPEVRVGADFLRNNPEWLN